MREGHHSALRRGRLQLWIHETFRWILQSVADSWLRGLVLGEADEFRLSVHKCLVWIRRLYSLPRREAHRFLLDQTRLD